MSSSLKIARVLGAVLLATCAQACMSYQPVRQRPLSPELENVRIRAPRAFLLHSAVGSPPGMLCETRDLRGRLLRVRVDTVVLDLISAVIEPRTDASIPAECPPNGTVAIVLAPDAEVTAPQVHSAASLTAVAVAVAALLLIRARLGLD